MIGAVNDSTLSVLGVSCYRHEYSNVFSEPSNALILWNDNKSRDLLIDRFDVRGLLSNYNEFCKRKLVLHGKGLSENGNDELLYERYLDLFDVTVELPTFNNNFIESVQDTNIHHSYSNAKFDYSSNRVEIWEKPKREDYTVSNYLAVSDNNPLPMTKKQFDVMLYTVKSVREKHNAQFEILLKVKHSDNSVMFDFLNAESELFPLYQQLKTLPEETFWQVLMGKMKSNEEIDLSSFDTDSGADNDDNLPVSPANKSNIISNALELLGSMYDDSDEEDVADDIIHLQGSDAEPTEELEEVEKEKEDMMCAEDVATPAVFADDVAEEGDVIAESSHKSDLVSSKQTLSPLGASEVVVTSATDPVEDRTAIRKELSSAVAIAMQIAAAARERQQRIHGGGEVAVIVDPVVSLDAMAGSAIVTSGNDDVSSVLSEMSNPTATGSTTNEEVDNSLSSNVVVPLSAMVPSVTAPVDKTTVEVDPLLSGPVTADNIAFRLEHESYREGIPDGQGSTNTSTDPVSVAFTPLAEMPADSDFSDDGLDDDEDASQPWGRPHVEKRERLAKQLRAARLRRAKECRSHFNVSVAPRKTESGGSAATSTVSEGSSSDKVCDDYSLNADSLSTFKPVSFALSAHGSSSGSLQSSAHRVLPVTVEVKSQYQETNREPNVHSVSTTVTSSEPRVVLLCARDRVSVPSVATTVAQQQPVTNPVAVPSLSASVTLDVRTQVNTSILKSSAVVTRDNSSDNKNQNRNSERRGRERSDSRDSREGHRKRTKRSGSRNRRGSGRSRSRHGDKRGRERSRERNRGRSRGGDYSFERRSDSRGRR